MPTPLSDFERLVWAAAYGARFASSLDRDKAIRTANIAVRDLRNDRRTLVELGIVPPKPPNRPPAPQKKPGQLATLEEAAQALAPKKPKK